jgi:hypothetical protein
MLKSLFLSSTNLLWLSLTVLFLFVPFSIAATRTWDGGGSDNNWNTAANWVGDVAPVAGDDLIFPASAPQQSNSNNIGVFTNFNSILIEGGSYTVSGSPFSTTAGITVNSGGNLTALTVIRLNAAQTFTVNQLAVLTIGFGVTNNGNTLTIDGGGASLLRATTLIREQL